jgi:prefoldin subunit 5
MEDYLKKSLEEWKEEICDLLMKIDDEYEEVKRELQIYSYKFSITRQVIQSTVNEELIRDIREIYHTPFEQKFEALKDEIRDLDEKKKVFQMFVDKIDSVKGRNERQQVVIEQ